METILAIHPTAKVPEVNRKSPIRNTTVQLSRFTPLPTPTVSATIRGTDGLTDRIQVQLDPLEQVRPHLVRNLVRKTDRRQVTMMTVADHNA